MAGDALLLRGRGWVEGRVLAIGARTVRLEDDRGVTHDLPAHDVAAYDLEGTPPALREGLDALSEGRFDDALEAFEAVAAHQPCGCACHTGTLDHDDPCCSAEAEARAGWLRAWGAFHQANARRVRADVARSGQGDAARALGAWREQHPDDALTPAALLAEGQAWLAAGDREKAGAAAARLDDAAWGPVWRLHAQVLRARVELEGGAAPEAQRRLEDVIARAATTGFASEPLQLAHAWAAEARRRAGDARGALQGVPRATGEDGQEGLAPLSADWLGSPATPVLLNAMGRALRDLWPGAEGAAAAVPFHLRVTRYFPTFHGEHARALASAAECFEACGQAEWAGAMRHDLKARYPDAAAGARRGPQGVPGGR